MSQSLVNIPVHLVFSTRFRWPYLNNRGQREDLHRYMHGICRNMDCPCLRINGPADHVHILCSLGKQQCVSDLIRDLKSCSTKYLKRRYLEMHEFSWQKGYGAFAVCEDRVGAVVRYIANQEARHQGLSYKNEYRKLCNVAGLTIDERYAWD